MEFPDFNEHGDLPSKLYKASLGEVIHHFGSSTSRREIIATRLVRIYGITKGTGHLKRFIIFGSFVNEKPYPNDIDIFMIMDDDFDVTQVDPSGSVLFDRPIAPRGERFLGEGDSCTRRRAVGYRRLDADARRTQPGSHRSNRIGL
ncbi:MAG: hypothetical protein ACI8XO_002188 [Verrucomicrobiales bacterium]|jgi:hypothetical protein